MNALTLPFIHSFGQHSNLKIRIRKLAIIMPLLIICTHVLSVNARGEVEATIEATIDFLYSNDAKWK